MPDKGEKFIKASNLIIPLVMALVIGSTVYTAFTGDDLGTDTHYDVGGRIFSGVAAIALTGFMVWTWRANRRLGKRIAEDIARRRAEREEK